MLFPAVLALSGMGCGGLNTVIPAEDAYPVSAFAADRSLDEGSFVAAGEEIRPVFLQKVGSDPDLYGLRVAIASASGDDQAEAVVYALDEAVLSRNAAKDDAVQVLVASLDAEFPAFLLPEDLSSGWYRMTFTALGRQGDLSESSKPFFYLGSASFSVGEAKAYPPGSGPYSAEPLFPPGVNLLLDLPLDYDASLDPYLIWTYKGKTIREGSASKGAARMLWTTPDSEGFHALRVEAFPAYPAGSDKSRGAAGSIRRLSVAVSSQAAVPGLPGPLSSFERLFRFLGTLTDAVAPEDSSRALVYRGDADGPRWLPAGDSYGAALRRGETLRLEAPLIQGEEGKFSSAILLRCVPAQGSILSMHWGSGEEPDLSLVLSSGENGALRLSLASGDSSSSSELTLTSPQRLAFRDIELRFAIEGSEFSASLSADGSSAETSAALTLPSSALPSVGQTVLGDPRLPGEEGQEEARDLIIDELGVRF